MSKAIRKEWEQFLFDERRYYALNEAIEKVKNAVMFLKKKSIRITESFFLDTEQYDLDFRLSESEKELYIREFVKEGYAINDCATIVNVMDVIYHTFAVTKEIAFDMARYSANNHLTLTRTIYDKLNVDFDEIVEFVNIVFPEILKYFIKKTRKKGRELSEIINEMLSSLE